MPDSFVAISIDGLKEIEAKLAKLPEAAGDAGVDESNKYMINVLRINPPEKRVTRKAAFGTTFFTVKQRRWFFAALHSGELQLPYRRTQALSRGWKIVGAGHLSFLANESDHADLVVGDGQNRMSKLIGWKKAGDNLKEHINQIVEKFDVGVKKAIKKLGLA